MELRDYLRILRRRWTLIVGCIVAALALATLVTVRATPQYASNARIFISTGSASASEDGSGSNPYQNGLAATQKVTSYAQLVTDGELAQRVIDKMHLDLTPAQLSRKIKAQVVPDTVLLNVQVVDADPKMAQAICKQVVSNLLDLIEQIETDPGKKTANLKGTVVGPATLPTNPISPNPLRNLVPRRHPRPAARPRHRGDPRAARHLGEDRARTSRPWSTRRSSGASRSTPTPPARPW